MQDLDFYLPFAERVAKEEQLVQKISSAEQNLCNVEEDHRARVEKLTAEHVRKVLLLENNLQQLAEEHDAETEQNKYEYARQVEELSAVHAQAVTEMANQHSARIAEVSATHKEEVDAIKAASGVLSGEKLALQESKQFRFVFGSLVCNRIKFSHLRRCRIDRASCFARSQKPIG